jgi:hypothetical protein
VIVTCKRLVEITTAERESAVPEWERRHYREHLEVCGPCRRWVEGFDRTVELLHELPEQTAPEPMRADLLERFRRKSKDA